MLQIFLATVFLFSGAAKLTSRFSFYETLSSIGFKDASARRLSWIFPFVEIVAAALLLIEPLRLPGEALLLCMLAGFIVVSIRAIRAKEQKVDCQCFGNLVEEPLGTATLVRSLVLAACLIPLLLHSEGTGLYQMAATDTVSAVFCSLGILMIYAIAAAFRSRYRLAKGK
ncbi:hypothetical protein H8B09_09990 [Paenibacillus sp. PR3]|uniref:Methylamine utilisation protein MauE domain-containing protein n=1 Tax=Paenibacillus terricola TaxID=2763503 RepID=A0ABR8MSZ3_9BACL|nr:MauE/DoxX family redox-associated membrane protein [Paenibacillus terricola]MBD3919085.1 hypothetical protein [Paenibacillus terricola]